MITFFSIKRHIHTIIPAVTLILLSVISFPSIPAHASVTGAPLIGAFDTPDSETIDLSALIGPDADIQAAHREYERLERECATLTDLDIMTKASYCFVQRKNVVKGAMYMKIVMSKYNDDMSPLDKLNCATAFGNMGYYLIFERNNPIQAYPLLIKGLEICNQIEFEDIHNHHTRINTISGINTNIAKIFSIFRDSRRALHYYRHAYQTAKDDNNPIALPMTFTDLLHPPLPVNPARGSYYVYINAYGYSGDYLYIMTESVSMEGYLPFDGDGCVSGWLEFPEVVYGERIQFSSYNFMPIGLAGFEVVQAVEKGDRIMTFLSSQDVAAGVQNCTFSDLDNDGMYAFSVASHFTLEKESTSSGIKDWVYVNMNKSIPMTSIETIDSSITEAKRFTINGQKASPDYKGVVIVKMSDGSVAKKVVK